MQGLFAEAYQPLGNLRLTFTHAGATTKYRRELNLDTACARVSYTVDNVHFEREAFASFPDQVLVVHAKANVPGRLHCSIFIDGPLQKAVVDSGVWSLAPDREGSRACRGRWSPRKRGPGYLLRPARRRHVFRFHSRSAGGRREGQ